MWILLQGIEKTDEEWIKKYGKLLG